MTPARKALLPLLLSLGATAHVAYRSAERGRAAGPLPRLRVLAATPLRQEPRPSATVVATSNRSLRGYGPLDTIVIHCTAGTSTASAVSHFQTPGSGASAHLVIPDRGQRGEPTRSVLVVPEAYKSWHTRYEVSFQGRLDVNSRSLGIELVNSGRQDDPYSDWQVAEAARWTRYWLDHYPIRYLTTHAYLDPSRRRDPCTTFPWDQYVSLVTRDLFEDSPRLTLLLGNQTSPAPGRLHHGAAWGELRPVLQQLGHRVQYDPHRKLLRIDP